MNVLQKSIQKVQKDLQASQIWISQEALLMRCGSENCAYNCNGQCTVSEFDECPCLALVNPPYDCAPKEDD